MRIKLLILTSLLVFFGVNPVSAITVTISDVPQTISDQPFTFNVSVSGAQASTNYLRANFSQIGKTNYFGYTYNSSSFINSSTCADYLAITIDSSGNWSGTVQAKIDTSSSYYKGTGDYSFRVRRYTKSCSPTSYLWSNEVITKVSISSPIPTPLPTSIPTPSPNPTITSPSSFTITNTPTQINSDQSFSVSVNLSLPNSPNANFYLKGAFRHPDKPSNYFGLTKVGGSWVKNSSILTNQYKITTDSSGNWLGTLEVKPDTEDSGFIGSGDYIFKVARYTSSGSGPTWSNESSVNISATTQSAEGSTNTEVDDSYTLSNTPTPLSTTTSKSNLSKTSNPIQAKYQIASVAAVTSSATPSSKVAVKTQKQFNFFLLVGMTLVFAGISSLGYIYLKRR